jgi:hypothetical protein
LRIERRAACNVRPEHPKHGASDLLRVSSTFRHFRTALSRPLDFPIQFEIPDPLFAMKSPLLADEFIPMRGRQTELRHETGAASVLIPVI